MENQYTRRIQKTKYAIYKALLGLLEKEDLKGITIRELCSCAGINRSTFYKYYGSQYDVLTEMGDAFLSDLSRQLPDTVSADQNQVERQVARCLQKIMEQRQLVMLLMSHPDGEEFEEKLFAVPKIDKLLDEALSYCTDEAERKATFSFAIHGSCHLIEEWLKNGCRQTPEQEAKLILKLVRRVCKRETA